MSKQRRQKKDRVQLSNLPQKQRELNSSETKNVKGGGAAGGVVLKQTIGEEIPSKL